MKLAQVNVYGNSFNSRELSTRTTCIHPSRLTNTNGDLSGCRKLLIWSSEW